MQILLEHNGTGCRVESATLVVASDKQLDPMRVVPRFLDDMVVIFLLRLVDRSWF